LFAGTLALLLGGAVEAAFFLGLAKGMDALGIAFAIFLACMAALVNARNAKAYEDSERLSKDLAEQILERERMFSEIHDGFRTQLGEAVRLVTDTAHEEDTGEITRQLPVVGGILDHCLGELRDLMWILRDEPVTLADLALHLRDHVALHLASQALQLDYSSAFTNPDRNIPRSLQFHLFRIIQEWTTNTLKHAQASHVSLRLQELDGQLAIRYSDDGVGFDENAPLPSGHGLELLSQRCQQLRGLLTLRTEPGKGFQATLHLSLVGRTLRMPEATKP
jgi:NarL family two-component system sensor histidine kinase LiaS